MKVIRAGNINYDIFHFAWTMTNWCNYDCSYCYEKPVMVDKWQKENSMTSYKLVLNKLKNFDAPFEIELVGGEPTLHKNLQEIFLKLCEIPNCKKIELFTNLSRPLSYFINLNKPELSLLTICASFHPEHYEEEFFEKLYKINKMKHLNIRVSVNISDNPEHWPITLNLLNKLIENKIEYGLHWLHENSVWNAKYTNECFETFHKFETLDDIRYTYEFEDTIQQMTSLQIYNKNLHKFKGYKCTPRYFEIKFDGTISNTCTEKKVNSLILKKDEMLKKVKCPKDCCVCESMLYFFKEI